jgi:ferredoxin-like protein FixX
MTFPIQICLVFCGVVRVLRDENSVGGWNFATSTLVVEFREQYARGDG